MKNLLLMTDRVILSSLLTKAGKCGYITVTHKDTRKVHNGLTVAFIEGLSCYMSNKDKWFNTSVVKKIDWDKKEFETQNSIYEFEFKEISWKELYADLQLYINESKNKEIE